MDEVIQITKDIKAGNIKPIYFFMGEEPYYIDKLTDFIKLLQFVAYNRYKSKHSEEIATYVLDKLFEIICHDFF